MLRRSAPSIASGAIASHAPVAPDQIQPASLDLRLGRRALRMRASFLPGAGRTVEERTDLAMHEMALDGGAVLERGCVYLVPLEERLALPADLHAVANAKSSTGRVDLLTRLITDGGTEFDRIAPGYQRTALGRDLPAVILGAGAAGNATQPDPPAPRRGAAERTPS